MEKCNGFFRGKVDPSVTRTLSTTLRATLALVLAVLALLLAWPEPITGRSRSWEDVLAPLNIGAKVGDYEISSLRRGEEHDVVLTLRRTLGEGGAIEIHVLDKGRWKGIRESTSFGIAYEVPRSSASVEECEKITEQIAEAVRKNDSGELGLVDTIPLRAEADPPTISRALDRAIGLRGLAIGLCLCAVTWLLASLRFGGAIVSLWLLGLGVFLRGAELGVPFVRDQDVQRLFTGNLPFSQVLTGQGLSDRHPPLYFLVLHLAQWFGQSESVVRFPAVICGALLGPSLVWAAWVLRRRLDVGAILGLTATVSVELISRSREVSSIPLFGLMAIAAVVALVRCDESPNRKWTALVVITHGLMLWTYYIAIFTILGNLLALFIAQRRCSARQSSSTLSSTRRLSRSTLKPVGLGFLLGSPALVLGGITFFRDRGARVTAEQHPTLAWGSHRPGEMAESLLSVFSGAFGAAFVAIFVLATAWALLRRRLEVLLASSAFIATAVGIVALSPFARVQPYYVVAVLPLVLLALLIAGSDVVAHRKEPWLGAAAFCCVLAATVVPHVNQTRVLYIPDSDAFMPEFAAVIAKRDERRVVTIAHYDTTLLAYYLAQKAGKQMDWARMKPEDGGGFRLEGVERSVQPVVYSHALGDDPNMEAEQFLRQAMLSEPVLVVSREGFHLEGASQLLRRCDLIAQAGTGKLHRCPGERRPLP